MASHFLIHAALNWGEDELDNMTFWVFALDHTSYLYRRIIQMKSGMTPHEMATGYKLNHKDRVRTICGDAPAIFWKPSFKATRNSQSGSVVPAWASSWDSCVFTPLQWLWYTIFTRDTAVLSTIWYLMKSSKPFSMMERLKSNKIPSAKTCLRVVGNATWKKNTTRVEFSFMRPHLCMKYGCWKMRGEIERHHCRSSVKGTRDVKGV